MSKLRDNQALRDEARELILAEWHRTFRLGRIDSTALATDILDAVDRHLAQGGAAAGSPESAPFVKQNDVCKADSRLSSSAHPGHLQGEARVGECCKACGWNFMPTCVLAESHPPGAPTPTTTIIEPTPGPSHRPGGPPGLPVSPPEPGQTYRPRGSFSPHVRWLVTAIEPGNPYPVRARRPDVDGQDLDGGFTFEMFAERMELTEGVGTGPPASPGGSSGGAGDAT